VSQDLPTSRSSGEHWLDSGSAIEIENINNECDEQEKIPLLATVENVFFAWRVILRISYNYGAEVPRGVFCLLPNAQGPGRDPFVHYDVDVDGISVRQDWNSRATAECMLAIRMVRSS
jgi:hypothetical protein